MAIPLRVLVLEDRQADAQLMIHELRRAGYTPDWRRVENEEEFLAALQQPFDVILADFSLPQFDALRALEHVRDRALDIPLLIVSGTIGEEIAVAAMKRGASDYLLKDRLARLGPAVTQVLEQKALREARQRASELLQEGERRFRALIEHSSDGIALLDRYGTVLYASPSTTRILGYEVDELAGRNLSDLVHPTDQKRVESQFRTLLDQPGLPVVGEFRVRHKDGSWRWIESISNNLLQEQMLAAIVSNYREITERKESEEALQHYADRLQALSRRVVEVQEAERTLIAADLHDSVVQWLSGTLYRVEVVRRLLDNEEQGKAEHELGEIERALQHSIRELRSTIGRLYPAVLRRRGLVTALTHYVEEWREQHGVDSAIGVSGAAYPLSLPVETALYRICQEALNNVAKHACASSVDVNLEFGSDYVRLAVRDNGTGMRPNRIRIAERDLWAAETEELLHTHLGLQDMSERAQLLGGQLTLESAPGAGTSVSASIPVNCEMGDSTNEQDPAPHR
jgi:PAS domain S-box-containing protein